MKKIPTKIGQLYCGPCPYQKELDDNGPFDCIWNLAKELNPASYSADNIIYANIKDMDVPKHTAQFNFQLQLIAKYLLLDKKVFVHCLGGCGRTGLALASLFQIVEGVSIGASLKLAKKYVNGPETYSQIDFVKTNILRPVVG